MFYIDEKETEKGSEIFEKLHIEYDQFLKINGTAPTKLIINQKDRLLLFKFINRFTTEENINNSKLSSFFGMKIIESDEHVKLRLE